MATLQSTQDIRAHAIDRKRAAAYKNKWNPKWTNGEEAVKLGPNDTKRPAIYLSKRYTLSRRSGNAKAVRRTNEQRKIDRLAEDEHVLDHSEILENSGWESYGLAADGNPAQVHGCEVLTHAVTKAVQRFEDHQTTKLVHDEYEVVDSSDEPNDSLAGTTDDDDFELV